MALAYKELQDLDRAKENYKLAITFEPNNTQMRAEYEELIKQKTSKEREWYGKMNGFYDSDKLKQIEKKDSEDAELREKIKR